MTAALKMSRTSPDKKMEAALSKIKPELYDCQAKRNQISTVEALCLITFMISWHLNVNSSVRNTAASMFFTWSPDYITTKTSCRLIFTLQLESNRDSWLQKWVERQAVYTLVQRLSRESSKKQIILFTYVQLNLKLQPLYAENEGHMTHRWIGKAPTVLRVTSNITIICFTVTL